MPVDACQFPDQLTQVPLRPVYMAAVVIVHILAQQRNFAHTLLNQPAGFVEHLRRRPRELGTAGVGNHTKGAELVAAFLNGQKGRITG
jgi:hypothetical protein